MPPYGDYLLLRPLFLKNASSYIDKLNLTSANPTARLDQYSLRFEGIESGGDAKFNLSKYGTKVDTALAKAGSRGPDKTYFSAALAMIIILGIAWTFYPGAKEQPLEIQPEVKTPAVAGIPSVTKIPVDVKTSVVAETIIPKITPTGKRKLISLDRHKVLRGVSPGIRVGDEIIWVNDGLDPITVLSDNIPGFKEQVLDVGKKTMPYMFMSPGTYSYYLKSNNNVNGTIKVT